MPYSPIRLKQLDLTNLSGYILDVVDGEFVLLSGNQLIDGIKVFRDAIGVPGFGGGVDIDLNTAPSLIVSPESGVVAANSFRLYDGPSEFFTLSFFPDSGVEIRNFQNQIVFQVGGEVFPDGEQLLSGDWAAQSIVNNSPRINRRVVNESSYTVQNGDHYLAVNTSGSSKILTFPAPSNNREFKIKDIAGLASGNPIILSGDSLTFDYSPTYTMSDPYASVTLIAGPSGNYEVL